MTRKGFPDIAKTFSSKEDALKWSRSIEREMDTGTFLPRTVGSEMTLAALISRYRTEVVLKLGGLVITILDETALPASS